MERKNFGWHSRNESGFYQRRGYKGGHRGRIHGSNWREGGSNKEQSYYYEEEEDNRGYSRHGSWGRGKTCAGRGGKHPPGLRGKEIGMWYAHQSKSSMKAMNKAPSLSMKEEEAHAINEAIDGLAAPRKSLPDVKLKAERTLELECPSTSFDIDWEESLNEGHEYIPTENLDDFDSFDNPEVFIEKNSKKQRKDTHITDLLSRIQDSDFKSAYKANIEGNKLRDQEGFGILAKERTSKLVKKSEIDQLLYEDFLEKENNSLYREMVKIRQKLPSYLMKDKILDFIQENQVVVLSGETGCGKTTQVAQFVLDDCIKRKEGSTCRIVCTQPRRISAISVAERVAEERGEKLGKSVGYQIRLETSLPRVEGSVLYCTTGIILQWLQSDPLLSSISHLILDEIHERDTLSDFLICIAKDLLHLRPDLKVVLMSATLNADHFSEYFEGCPMIHIPGFTYDVREYFLEDVLKFTGFCYPAESNRPFQPWKRRGEDCEQKEFEEYIVPHLRRLEETEDYPYTVIKELYKRSSEEMNLDLVLSLLKHIAKQPPGAVLVFVPGWEQISKLHKMIQDDKFFGSRNFLVIPLHSLMPTVNQREVFNRPPCGIRKIVLATNIAETSITIDDIVYVIDTGRIKMKNYDKETNISTLLPEWVTLANAKQRRGRAGRVQEGVCFHLYTKAREMLLDAFPLPEIQRTRLEEAILQAKILRLGSCRIFLSKVMDSPEGGVIDVSVKMLQAINALDAEENLTPLGFHLARLPMDPLTGKMLLMGAIFSCLGPILTVAASLSFKDPFIMVLGKEKLVDKCRLGHAKGMKSDHLMLANVFSKWQEAKRHNANRFVWDNFLSSSILTQLKNMRLQFLSILKEHKFIDTKDPDAPEINLNSDNVTLVKAIITAGLYPNVARILKKPRGKFQGRVKGFALPDVKRAAIHPKSVNEQEKNFENSWLVYWEKIKTSKVYLHDTTMISNYPLLLFGQKLEYDAKEKLISVDSFVKVRSDKKVADVIQKLRKELDDLLEYKISHPGTTDWSEGSKEGRLLSLIVEILSNEKDSPTDSTRDYDSHSDDDDDTY